MSQVAEADDFSPTGEEVAGALGLHVQSFPAGDGTWRLDWLGELSYASRSIRSNQPAVTVWLSRVTNSNWEQGPESLLLPDSTAHRERIRREVALGTLVILRLGDLWRGQRLVARPSYEIEEFRDISVEREHSSIIKAGSSLEDGSFVLPAADHPWHMGATHSYCVQVRLADDRLLVIPALELARFYFGSSSALLTRLFRVGFERDSICRPDSHLDEESGLADLSLASGIPAASAHDVARIVFGRGALAKASLVSRSCLKAVHAGEPIHPQCVFPFVGKTSLKVKGKWLPRSGVPRQTFVVYEIFSCSHPFPYRALTYRQANATKSARGTEEANAGDASANTRSGRLNTRVGLLERDPGSQRAGKLLRWPLRERFPDLRYKRVVVDEAPLMGPDQPPRQGATDDDGFALGEAAGSSRVRPVELATGDPGEQSKPVPEFLWPALDALHLIECSFSILTAGEEDGVTLAVPETPGLKELESHPDYFIDGRPRRVCVLQLDGREPSAFVAICEGRPSSILVTQLNREFANERDAIEAVTVDLKRAWYRCTGEYHPVDSGESTRSEGHLAELFAQWLKHPAAGDSPDERAILIQH